MYCQPFRDTKPCYELDVLRVKRKFDQNNGISVGVEGLKENCSVNNLIFKLNTRLSNPNINDQNNVIVFNLIK